MTARIQRTVGAVVLALLGGAVISFALFFVTSLTPSYRFLGPICVTEDVHPGFDPWTGKPHGRNYVYDCPGNEPWERANPIPVVGEIPIELVGRRALPLPIGFGFGLGCALVVVAISRRDPRKPQSIPYP